MNDSPVSAAIDSGAIVVPLARLELASEYTDVAALPSDLPQWQRDVISMSARARAVAATIPATVVRALTFWDHRIREVAFGTRVLGIDPAGCYRLR